MKLRDLALAATLLSTTVTTVSADGVKSWRHIGQFAQWYSQYGFAFQKLLAEKCEVEYGHYLYDNPTNAIIYWEEGGGTANTLVQPVVSCLLDHMPQFIMSNMQSAQVLLGLTPTILAILGASTEESATLVVVGQRPFLSLMLALGSPSVYLSRAFEFKDPVEVLSKRRPQHYRPGTKTRRPIFHAIMVILQYMTAFAATANVSILAYELGTRAICLYASEWILIPSIWSVTVILIYLVGFGWHRLCVQRVKEGNTPETWVLFLRRRITCEFRLSVNNGPVKVKTAEERKLYIIIGWMLSVSCVLHIIFGTLTLSSMLFIGPRDAVQVIGRFAASGLLCRVITMYELAGLRENYVPVDTVDKDSMAGGSLGLSRLDSITW